MAERITARDSELDEDLKSKPTNDRSEDGGRPSQKTSDDQGADPSQGDPHIPVRRSVAQHIIARQSKQIEKLRSKVNDDDRGKPQSNDDDEDELTPEARSYIGKEFERRLTPVLTTLKSQADEDELQDLLANDPEAKRYEKTIRAYMSHESYDGVPPSVIFHHLDYEARKARRTVKKQAADLEARQMSGAGTTLPHDEDENTTGLPTADDIAEMSEADFESLQNKVRAGKFKPQES